MHRHGSVIGILLQFAYSYATVEIERVVRPSLPFVGRQKANNTSSGFCPLAARSFLCLEFAQHFLDANDPVWHYFSAIGGNSQIMSRRLLSHIPKGNLICVDMDSVLSQEPQ